MQLNKKLVRDIRSIGLLLTCVFCISAQAQSIRLSEPVEQSETSETFGAKMDTSLPKVNLAEVLTEAESYLGQAFQTETRIAKVCQKKGCFFIAQQEEHVVRVSFRDYGFFIPTDVSGRTVTLAGELVQKELSEKQAAHFKQDLNSQNAPIKPGVVYEIVADSVIIPKIQ